MIVTDKTLTIEDLQSLANDPEATRSQIGSVLKALTHPEEAAQWASEALENCGPPPSASIPQIAELLTHEDELLASWSCKLLARLGVQAASVEKQLTAALATRKEEIVREEAARALGQLGPLSPTARDALALAAQCGGARLKRLATASLGG